jgi:hypothetical protein
MKALWTKTMLFALCATAVGGAPAVASAQSAVAQHAAVASAPAHMQAASRIDARCASASTARVAYRINRFSTDAQTSLNRLRSRS